MKNKKNVIMIVMCILMLLMATGYAYFATRLNINATGNITSNWNVYFSNITSGTITGSATNAVTPSVTSTTANMEANLELPGDSITYELTLTNAGTIGAIIEDIDAQATGSSAIIYSISGIKTGDKLASGASVVITIKIEYDPNITSQPSETNKTLTVTIDAVQDIGQSIESLNPIINQPRLLSSAILSSNIAYADNVTSEYVSSSTGIDFSQPSSDTNGKGLYYTSTNTENNGTTYYFRGNVENNYVKMGTANTKVSFYQGCVVAGDESSCVGEIFGTEDECVPGWGTCKETIITNVGDDLLWRIVRINEDGTIKLMYDNIIGVVDYDVQNIGYVYGENNTDSVIKKYIDNWYSNNIEDDYSEYIGDATFCNDREITVTDDEGTIYYGGYTRLGTNKQPKYKCTNSDDLLSVSNGKLDKPIGLITADELAYAGLATGTSNTNYFLGREYYYWTMTAYYTYYSMPFVFTERSGVLDTDTTLGDIRGSSDIYAAVPVINLKTDVEVTGTGTIDDPYVIKTN